MKGYSAREAASLVGLTVGRVRACVKSGFLQPGRGPRGELVFDFQDIVLLRTAKGLMEAEIAPRRIKRALAQLKRQLPNGRPITAVSISAEGDKVIARDGRARWTPEDGQQLFDFDFDVAELAKKVAPLVRREARAARRDEESQTAESWYELGTQLEVVSPGEARDAYRRAVELDPAHADAHVNLGRLLHEARELAAAEAHYRLALDARQNDVTAAFNLGVVLEDLGRPDDAIIAYEQTVGADPSCADAHYNLSRLYERAGKQVAALRHLRTYQKLTRGR